MKRPSRRVVGGLAAAGLAIAAVIGIDSIQPKAVEVCVTVYEDGGQQGDHHPFCAVGATNVHIANLGSYNTPLINGCNRSINQSSTYNDCISSATAGLLPANTKVVFYQNINYVTQNACYSVDGTHPIDLIGTNDTISSFRIIGGSC